MPMSLIFYQLLAILTDKLLPEPERMEAFETLSAMVLRGGPEVAEVRPAYLDGLRSLIRDDAAEIRTRAQLILSLEQDPVVQDLLVTGLLQSEIASASPADAIAFLGSDSHGPLLPLLPRFLPKSVDEEVRLQALRFAALVPALLEPLRALVADRTESIPIRNAAMASVLVLDRTAFTIDALAILADLTDDDIVRQVARTGLSLLA